MIIADRRHGELRGTRPSGSSGSYSSLGQIKLSAVSSRTNRLFGLNSQFQRAVIRVIFNSRVATPLSYLQEGTGLSAVGGASSPEHRQLGDRVWEELDWTPADERLFVEHGSGDQVIDVLQDVRNQWWKHPQNLLNSTGHALSLNQNFHL